MIRYLSTRRRFIQGVLLAFFGGGTSLFAAEKLNYEYLQRQLYPKTEQEEAYLHAILDAADKGILPPKLIYMAVKSSGRRGKAKRIYYFEATLNFLAKKYEIKSVPALSKEEEASSGEKNS